MRNVRRHGMGKKAAHRAREKMKRRGEDLLKNIYVFLLAISLLFILPTCSGCAKTETSQVIEVKDSEGAPLEPPKLFAEGEPTKITKEQVMEIEKETTYREIVELLGPTVDIGSGLHVLHYKFENGDDFLLSVPKWDMSVNKTGEELLERNAKK